MRAISTYPMELRDLLAKVAIEISKNEQYIASCKPPMVFLGSVAEMICATQIKGTGVISAILAPHTDPTCDLEE